MKLRALVVTLAVTFAAGTVCLAAGPFAGTWKLNEAKSKLTPGTPKNTMVVYQDGAFGKTKIIVDGIDAHGKAAHSEWTGKFDGKDYAVTGDPTSDMRSYTKMTERTMDFTNKKGGKVTVHGRIILAEDHKSRTVTTIGTDAKGKKAKNVAFYDKQ